MSTRNPVGSRSTGATKKPSTTNQTSSSSRSNVSKQDKDVKGPKKSTEAGSKATGVKTGAGTAKTGSGASKATAGVGSKTKEVGARGAVGASSRTGGSKVSSSSGLGTSKSSSSSVSAGGKSGASKSSTKDASKVTKKPVQSTTSKTVGEKKTSGSTSSSTSKTGKSTASSGLKGKDEKGPARVGSRAAAPPPAAPPSKHGTAKGVIPTKISEEVSKPKPKREGTQKSPRSRPVLLPTPVEEVTDPIEEDDAMGSDDSMEAVAASVLQDDIEEEGDDLATSARAEGGGDEYDYEDDFEDYDDDFEPDDEEEEEEEEDEFADMRNEEQREDDEGVSDVETEKAVGGVARRAAQDDDHEDQVDSGHSSGHFNGASPGQRNNHAHPPSHGGSSVPTDPALLAAIAAENAKAADFAARQQSQMTTQQRRNAMRPESGLVAVEGLRNRSGSFIGEPDSGAHAPLRQKNSSDSRQEQEKRTYDFSAAKKRQQSAIVAGRTAKRGAELMDIISLETSAADLFEMAPSDYEAYIRRFGRSDAKQIGMSTSDDLEFAETQTEVIRCASKWVQYPPCFKPPIFSKDPAANGEDEEQKMYSISKEDFLGVGSGYDPLCFTNDGDPGSVASHEAFTFDSFVNGSNGSSDPLGFDDLRSFAESAGRLVMAVLQEERSIGDEDVSNGLANKGFYVGDKSLQEQIPFSGGFVPIGPSGDGRMLGKAVSKVVFSPFAPSLMLTCHEDGSLEGSHGDVEGNSHMVVWNLLEASVPQKVLRSRGFVTSMCFGPGHHSPTILAGTKAGAICVWDTSESSGIHEALAEALQEEGYIDKKEESEKVTAEEALEGEMKGRTSEGEGDSSVGWTIRAPTYVTLSKGAKASSLFKAGAAIVALKIVPSSFGEDGKSAFQVVSLTEGGLVEFWMASPLTSTPEISQLESDPGLAFWGKVKLSKLSQMHDLAKDFASDLSLPSVSDPFKGENVKCLDLAVQSSDANRLYVCTDSKMGVAHVSRTGGKPFPRSYKPEEDGASESCSVASFPFGHPFLLVGTSDGAVKLFNGSNDKPITYWNAADYVPIKKILWSPFRPLVFFALDENGRLYAWDLNQGDLSPIFWINLKSVRIVDFSLSAFNDGDGPARPPHFALVLSDGRVVVSKFNNNLLSSGGSAEEELGKFLHYVSIL